MYFGPPVTGVNGADRKEYAWGVFYFRRDIKTTTEYLLYSLLSMLAEIGGYVGLLLGASLVNIGQVNSYFLDKCLVKKRPDETTKIDQKTANHQIKVNNVSQNNYF